MQHLLGLIDKGPVRTTLLLAQSVTAAVISGRTSAHSEHCCLQGLGNLKHNRQA